MNDDPLAPARGIFVALAGSALCWAFILGCGYLGYRLSFVV